MDIDEARMLAANNRMGAVQDALKAVHVDDSPYAAYRAGVGDGFCGAFGPEGCPEFARVIWEEDTRLLEEANDDRVVPRAPMTDWRGKRAISFQDFAAEQSRWAFVNYQRKGSCTGQSKSTILNCCLATDKRRRGERHRFPKKRIGIASIYSHRGHRGDGMSLPRAMEASTKVNGISVLGKYGNYDLTDEQADENYGDAWWQGMPSEVHQETRQHMLLRWAKVTNVDEALAYLLDGRYLFHGSTYTAAPNGQLISPLQVIGGHAQAVLGFDATDVLKRWYFERHGIRIPDDEAVIIHDQSWGPQWNKFDRKWWPAHLWGEFMPEGVWCILLSDYRKIVGQWGDQYVVIDVGGFPDDGQETDFIGRPTWKRSPTPEVDEQRLVWSVNGQQQLVQTLPATADKSHSGDLVLRRNDAVDLALTALADEPSNPVTWSGKVGGGGIKPEPPSDLGCSFERVARERTGPPVL